MATGSRATSAPPDPVDWSNTIVVWKDGHIAFLGHHAIYLPNGGRRTVAPLHVEFIAILGEYRGRMVPPEVFAGRRIPARHARFDLDRIMSGGGTRACKHFDATSAGWYRLVNAKLISIPQLDPAAVLDETDIRKAAAAAWS